MAFGCVAASTFSGTGLAAHRARRSVIRTIGLGDARALGWHDVASTCASYLMLLLAVGVTLGWAQARQETSRVNEELGQRYVQVLDPYLTPRRW
jgi:hypothetical protein